MGRPVEPEDRAATPVPDGLDGFASEEALPFQAVDAVPFQADDAVATPTRRSSWIQAEASPVKLFHVAAPGHSMVATRGPGLAAHLVDAVVDAVVVDGIADVTGDDRSRMPAARRGVSDGG